MSEQTSSDEICGEFYATDGSGNISLFKQDWGWRQTWKLIVTGKFGGKTYTDRLFYDPATGEGEFYTTDSSGKISVLKKYTGWPKTWELIIPGNFGGNAYTDLLFYDPTTGEAEFYTTGDNGNISLLKKYTGWRKTWHSIVPGNFGGNSYTDLLFYDPTTGEAEFYTTDGRGNLSELRRHTGWRKTWHSIIPGNFSENSYYTDLLLYDSTTGEGRFYATDGRGNLSELSRQTGWSKTWHSIIPGNFGGNPYTDLLFYDPTIGEVRICRTDGRGEISSASSHTGWRKTWELIVAGEFGGDRDTDDLIFYDQLKSRSVASDEDEIRKLFEETYASNVRAGDVDAYVAMFTEDAFWMPPESRDRRGPDEIADGFEEVFGNRSVKPELTAEEIQVIENFGYVVGMSSAMLYPEDDDSEPSEVKLRIVWLVRKEQGTWKIAREIWNSKPL
ncbi:MAG: SgcJ/EcaC family oxidoreductase [Iphinoe sp. HA4291-MV1]|jgi:uncharacterized protein (TIGR02246 family)|nr:SgcJ/EcaC family oxidoreductase [Iphinoe sp. HA4291-MV1]